jgi:hypothetical protein
MPFVPEISAEFSAPPEFSGDVLEKELSTGWGRTSDLQITNQILSHCATSSLLERHCGMFNETFRPFFCYWPQDFPAVSVFTGRDFPAVSVVNGRDFPAVSAVTGRGIFLRYL